MKNLTLLFILCARLCAGQINCDSTGANLPTDTTVCLGDTVKFTISGAESYTWTISGVTWINGDKILIEQRGNCRRKVYQFL